MGCHQKRTVHGRTGRALDELAGRKVSAIPTVGLEIRDTEDQPSPNDSLSSLCKWI